MRVVVIDDDRFVCTSLKIILEAEEDIQVEATGTEGEEAVQLCRKLRPDIMLMDIQMPEMSGLEAGRQILQEFPDMKILFLTTFSDKEYIVEALSMGAKGYLIKQNTETVAPALRAVMSGQNVFGDEIVTKLPGLMSRKESIYSLLRAKYILYSIALLIPTILMIPGMVTGKVSVLGCIAWLIFIPGAVYCCLFQLAVYNNKTTDLKFKDDQPAEYRHRSAESDFRRCFRHTFTAAFCTECHLWQRGHPLDTYRHRRGIYRHFQILADECISPAHETPLQEYGRLQGQ